MGNEELACCTPTADDIGRVVLHRVLEQLCRKVKRRNWGLRKRAAKSAPPRPKLMDAGWKTRNIISHCSSQLI